MTAAPIPETVSLPSETIVEITAELWAVETLLTRLWGYQDGGDGNLADRVGNPGTRLLHEAFPEWWDQDVNGLFEFVDGKRDEILASWLEVIGKPTSSMRQVTA